ncbi:MAG TPA: hypothetical protein DDY14_10105 [Chromatiaceae bacterium]|nr:MAG: hypothetical protein N838_28430 [Thiohalocapsa sp. PB-PSB1]HBG95650.1 hypothetical protein [Chromatiaceae bacterium]
MIHLALQPWRIVSVRPSGDHFSRERISPSRPGLTIVVKRYLENLGIGFARHQMRELLPVLCAGDRFMDASDEACSAWRREDQSSIMGGDAIQ